MFDHAKMEKVRYTVTIMMMEMVRYVRPRQDGDGQVHCDHEVGNGDDYCNSDQNLRVS